MRCLLIGIALVLSLAGCASAPPPATSEAAPVPARRLQAAEKRDAGLFLRKHAAFLQRAQEGPVELLFLGDSITEGWSKAPAVWQQHYGGLRAANFGIGGDRIEHVLWRLDNGELDRIRPRVIVLMIGTNNSASQSGDDIATGVRDIIATLQAKSPASRVLLLGIFPRGPRKNSDGSPDDGVRRMAAIHTANASLAKLDDGQRVRYLDIGERFLVAGRIPSDVMPDQLHPALKGYEIWAAAMQPLLAQMLAAPPGPY
ncbi:MAG: GDSL-type esterase/lipase family protein [Rhodocyclaceae bacterium]